MLGPSAYLYVFIYRHREKKSRILLTYDMVLRKYLHYFMCYWNHFVFKFSPFCKRRSSLSYLRNKNDCSNNSQYCSRWIYTKLCFHNWINFRVCRSNIYSCIIKEKRMKNNYFNYKIFLSI